MYLTMISVIAAIKHLINGLLNIRRKNEKDFINNNFRGDGVRFNRL